MSAFFQVNCTLFVVHYFIIELFKTHKNRSKMKATQTISFKGNKTDDTNGREIRQERRALKRELEDTKRKLANTQASADAQIHKLEFENKILEGCYEWEIGRANAECIAHARLSAKFEALDRKYKIAFSDREKAWNALSQECACTEFLTKPPNNDPRYIDIVRRIFSKFPGSPAQRLCILHFWNELYKLENMKVVEFIHGTDDTYSVFDCIKITVLKGLEWRDAMVQLVSTKHVFQREDADWYKYDPENPTACVERMLKCTKFKQPQFALDAADGVPENDPIWYKEFCWLF